MERANRSSGENPFVIAQHLRTMAQNLQRSPCIGASSVGKGSAQNVETCFTPDVILKKALVNNSPTNS